MAKQNMTIEEMVGIAKSDPNGSFANAFLSEVDSGKMDNIARTQGYDLSPIRPEFKKQTSIPNPLTRFGSQLKDIPQDIIKTGQNISGTFNRGMDKIGNIQDRTISGEQSLGSGTFQTIGQGLSTGAGIIGDLFIGGASLATTPEEEQIIQDKLVQGVQALGKTDVGQGVAELADQYNAFKEKNPEIAGNLEASLGFAEAVLEVTGAGVGLKAAKKGVNATGDAIGQGIKQAGDVVSELGSDIKKLVPDMTPKQIKASGLTKKQILAGIRPDIQKSIAGQEKGLKEYFDVTRKRLGDETAKTPTGLLTEKAEGAFKQVEEILGDTGKGIGAKREKLGNVKASNDQTKSLINAVDSELKSMGLVTSKKGSITKGKGIVDVSDAELKLISELRSDLLKVRGDAKVSTIQKAINKFRNRVNFGKSSQEVSGVMDGLLKRVSSKASDINKNILGNESAGLYSKYSEISEFLKDTKNIRKNPQVVLRRILSSDSSKGLEFAETIKELTGVDLIKESRFAKIAVDTFGEVNPELGTRFRQQLTDSGVDASRIVGAVSGKAGAAVELLKAVRDIPSSIRREMLLRKGINPAEIDAEELAEIILESARGSQKKAKDIVEEVIETKGKVDLPKVKSSSVIDDTFLDTDKAVKDLGKRIKDTPNKQGGFVDISGKSFKRGVRDVKTTESTGEFLGSGKYFTDTEEIAKKYGKVSDVSSPKNAFLDPQKAKISELNIISDNILEKLNLSNDNYIKDFAQKEMLRIKKSGSFKSFSNFVDDLLRYSDEFKKLKKTNNYKTGSLSDISNKIASIKNEILNSSLYNANYKARAYPAKEVPSLNTKLSQDAYDNGLIFIETNNTNRNVDEIINSLFNQAKKTGLDKGSDLIAEAKKFDNVEDFINSQIPDRYGDTYYHASDVSIDKVQPRFDSNGELGAGFYISDNKSLVENFGKDIGLDRSVVNTIGTKDIKLKTMSKSDFVQGVIEFKTEEGLRRSVIEEGFDGILDIQTQQGVVFPESVGKLKTKKELTDIFNQAKNTN
jgi:ribosomal protein S13